MGGRAPSPGMAVLYYKPKTGFFRTPFSQMSTDLDEIWQESVAARNTLVGFY